MEDISLRTIAALSFGMLVAACSADPNEAANKLFVEAQQLIKKAEQLGPEERFVTLQSAEEKLKTIISNFPAATLAVQLSSGQSIGAMSLSKASESVAQAKEDVGYARCVITAKGCSIPPHHRWSSVTQDTSRYFRSYREKGRVGPFDLDGTSIEEIKNTPALFSVAINLGSASFKLHCELCHGAGAQGLGNTPNLNDDDWSWGGTLQDIELTIMHGVRAPNDANTRDKQGAGPVMPSWSQRLGKGEIVSLAIYVHALGGGK